VRLRARMTVTDRQIQERFGRFQQVGVVIRNSCVIGTTLSDAIPVSGDATSD
jgi:hypothetical protein